MRISKKAEYALRALIAIARAPRNQTHQIQELSASERIPVKFLEQILLSLRHAGILSSKRGVGGGYMLRANPAEITMGQVISLMDGPIAPVACAAGKPQEECTCPDERTCPLRLAMTEVQAELNAMLNKRTIEDMIQLGRTQDTIAYDI